MTLDTLGRPYLSHLTTILRIECNFPIEKHNEVKYLRCSKYSVTKGSVTRPITSQWPRRLFPFAAQFTSIFEKPILSECK